MGIMQKDMLATENSLVNVKYRFSYRWLALHCTLSTKSNIQTLSQHSQTLSGCKVMFEEAVKMKVISCEM